jgi:hypothetical protein
MKPTVFYACVLSLCLSSNIDAMAGTHYRDYKSTCKAWYGLSITLPTSYITEVEGGSDLNTFTFGQELEELPTLPIFCGGLMVTLDENCHVVMRDLSHETKPNPKSFPTIDSNMITNYTSPFSGMMLNNCGLPWANWFLNGTGGVIVDGKKNSKPSEATLKQVNECRNKYIRTVSNTKLTERTNTDCIYIVRIPNVDKIECENSSFNKLFEASNTECYGVEFYRAYRYNFTGMLFFVNAKDGKTIDDYIELVSHYISFDKDFTFE